MTTHLHSQPPTSSASSHPLTLMTLIVTLGIVFGDIGTSPLYVMKTIAGVNPDFTADYIIGAVSCVIWTLTLQTTVKYVVIALRADNRGEGGVLALFALVRRRAPRGAFVLAAVGAGALIADGVITPAITVTSAVEGLRAFSPSVPVVPIVLAIITLIFLVQQFGTSAIGKGFGPFMLLWFLMLGVLGACNIGRDLSILAAFNPLMAVRLLVASPEWFLILGAVFLCTTGAEALYSDLGHCGRRNITVAWLFVKLMLILNYLGQGAWLISQPAGAVAGGVNPFYAIMPAAMLPFGIAMSAGAAIIASQALLSGSFTLFNEAVNLDFFPRLNVKHPTRLKGQIYLPAVNRALYVGCVATVLIFRDSAGMEAAYGLAITVAMLMTTLLLALWLRGRRVATWLTAAFLVLFVSIEGCFLLANVAKFVHGGWFTMALAGIICGVMLVWHRAIRIRRNHVKFEKISRYLGLIGDISRDCSIPPYASNVVYLSHAPSLDRIESKLIYSIVNKGPKRADHYWLLHIEHTDRPDTLTYSYKTLIPGTLIVVKIRLGFRTSPKLSVYLRQIVEDITRRGEIDLRSSVPALRERGISGNFRFIMIHRVFSADSNCSWADSLVMYLHSRLRLLGVSDERFYGLDTSLVSVETVPLIINSRPARRIEYCR